MWRQSDCLIDTLVMCLFGEVKTFHMSLLCAYVLKKEKE